MHIDVKYGPVAALLTPEKEDAAAFRDGSTFPKTPEKTDERRLRVSCSDERRHRIT
jgi:hypothetical protein